MEMLRKPGRRYRRFRHENRYDKPLLIFLIDTFLAVARLGLLVLALLSIWLLADRLRQSSQPSSVKVMQSSLENTSTTPEVNSQAVGTQVIIVDAAKEAKVLTLKAAVEDIETIDTAARTRPDLVDEEWITQLDPEHYIVQYSSSTDLESLKEFVPVIDNAEEIAIYPFKENQAGRLVYGIATGVFPDLDTALKSLEELPAEARAHNPWIRPVRELIEQVNDVADL